MSLAWCPNCEILTNDCSTPCCECGGPLEYAVVAPTDDGEPCSHAGCLSHVTHPCEGCGRIGGITKPPQIYHID